MFLILFCVCQLLELITYAHVVYVASSSGTDVEEDIGRTTPNTGREYSLQIAFKVQKTR